MSQNITEKSFLIYIYIYIVDNYVELLFVFKILKVKSPSYIYVLDFISSFLILLFYFLLYFLKLKEYYAP